MKGVGGFAAVIFALPAALIAFVLFMGSGCGAGSSQPGEGVSGGLPASVEGWEGEQLENAAIIVDTIAERQLPTSVQVIAVAAAMGESSLVNLMHDDDATNPDGSTADGGGLFQQQVSQGWGTWEQVTDPVYATNTFVDRLIKVPGWDTMPVTLAINRVQGNSDPQHYAKFEDDARAVVAAVTGKAVTDPEIAPCPAGSGDFPPATGNPPGPWGGHENGFIPVEVLSPVPWDTRHVLRADATAALAAMNVQFRSEFGYDLPINDGYRDYANQVKAKEEYGDGAAAPGTSNHGWAMAVDIGDRSHYVIGFSHPTYLWLKANAGRYGWAHPDWAEPGGQGPDEAWHWEYYGLAS